ncbi:MAG: hypothetical protein R3Y35_00720 [Clostridia bacterium]
MATKIYTLDNITLVTLQGSPATVDFIAEVFDRISKRNINIDMISTAPTHAAITTLSFTISDDDLIEVLALTSELKKDLGINAIVSSVNHKVSVSDTAMKNTPGMASKLFTALKHTDADIRLITTSEVEISLLVSEADYDTVLDEINKAFN